MGYCCSEVSLLLRGKGWQETTMACLLTMMPDASETIGRSMRWRPREAKQKRIHKQYPTSRVKEQTSSPEDRVTGTGSHSTPGRRQKKQYECDDRLRTREDLTLSSEKMASLHNWLLCIRKHMWNILNLLGLPQDSRKRHERHAR